MAERSDYLYAQVRKKILDAVRMDLIGPTAAEEALTELPTNSYITGMLYPADSDITEDENYNDVEFTEGRLDADGNGSDSVVLEDDKPDESTKGGFKKPSSIGVSFYLSEETNKINVDVYWGTYYSDKVDGGEVVDESLEEDYENKKKKKRQVYVREQMAETVELNLNDLGRAKTIPLRSNAHIFVYVIQMRLDNGYKMLSVYLHNNNKGGDEKEYERVMFQVELHVSTKDKTAVFIPEYICRKQELEDEYYYKGRPIFGRGRGCAATWNKREDEENAYSIDSTFIPNHEIPGVSAQVKDVPEKAFSMLQLGSPKKKEVSIANLRLLTALYGDWIKNELKENPQMQEASFQATGKGIIEKCLDSLRRMNEGIDLIEKDENAFKAFTFMNQSMYLQRSITAYSKDCGRGIPCSLSDYMKDNKEKGIEQDHSEWRPFQIAFILLNIKGLIDPESDERNIVDLLYFPTGGGKTEAYLGLIAFIIAYRRLTSDTDSDYEKHGGVTVFLRYTLRLTEDDITELLEKGEKPFRQYAGICASGQSVKTTLIRLYSVLLQEVFILSEDPKYQDYVDPYYTLVGYFNSIRELGGAVRLLDDDINSRLKVLRKKYKNARQRFLGFDGKKEITSRIPSYQIAEILEKLAEPFDPSKERQSCYDVVIATNMIAVGMDVDRLGLMAVVGQPKQNSEYIQATSRVGRKYPGIIFTVYNPYRPRDLSNYENFVGFHSQMYRYVEGTTATPFAARARDRVLHALVVAMLRLQTETMAGNKGASNILSISDEELRKIKDQILERVSIVAPMAYESASDDIDAFISIWKEIAKDKNLYYFVANTENNKRLLSFYGQPVTGKEKPTLNSMRDVEQSSTVYLYEEGGEL